MPNPKHMKRRESERDRDPRPFGSSFYMFFLLPLDLPYVNSASQECCLLYLRSSLWSSDLPLFYFRTVQLSHPYMTTGKTIALTRQTFVGKVMSLLFNISIY